MFDRQIAAAVEREVTAALDRRTVRPDKKLTVDGYHPLPEILGTMYEWLLIPFRGAEILVEVRYPRSTQLPDVDKLHALVKDQKEGRQFSRQDMIDILNIQEHCCKATLNRPTFAELEKAIHGKDNVIAANKKLLDELREQLKLVKGDAARRELQMEIDRAELFTGYVLPDDTMLALTNIALGIGITDIQQVTKDKLLTAYGKARLYGGKPSDFVPGLFTDGDRQNIDDYATMLGVEAEKPKGGIKKR